MFKQIAGLSILRSIYNRSFVLLWSGQTISRIGDFLYELALAWWVLEKTGSAAAMATVLIFSSVPMLVFLLIGGVAVDRFPPVQVMFVSDLVRGVVTTLVALLAFMNILQIWQIYLASLVFGLVDGFFQPAYTKAIPEITAEADLTSANSLSSLGIQAGRIVGPAVGGGIVSLGGTSAAFALNAFTFFISAAILLPLLHRPRRLSSYSPNPGPVKSPSPEGDPPANLVKDLREGIRIVLGTPWLWITIVVFAISNITLSGPYAVSMPFLVKDHLKADVRVLGLLYAIFPIGYVAGSLWLGGKNSLRHRGVLIYISGIVAGVMLALIGLTVSLWALCLAAFINGAAMEVGSLTWINTLQTLIPREKLGRVSSVDTLGSFALFPIGYGIFGWATELIGAPSVFLLGGGITALITLLVFVLAPAVRKLD